MAFTDHKISAFTHKISDLADQPNLPPDELKARFDACPEELRQAVNAICDDAARLDTRVSGIVTETFGDAIPKSMLSDELAAELDAKAVETSVASRLATEAAAREAETAAREAADEEFDTRITGIEYAVPQKCEVIVDSYLGNGTYPRTIELGYHPRCVFIATPDGPVATMNESYSMLIIDAYDTGLCATTDTGFLLKNHTRSRLNETNKLYLYMVVR